jgi:sugar phosphate isomerase/epimerase
MQLGIFAKTFSGTSPSVVLRQVKAAGFDVAQYNMACSGLAAMPDAINKDVIVDVRTAVAETGVTLNALSATYNMAHPDVAVRAHGNRCLEVIAKAAQDLAIPLVTLCTGSRDAFDQWRHHPDNNSAEAWRDMMASMAIAVDIADRYNVNLGIEPELANIVSNAAKAKALIDECKSPRIKIVLDAANLFEVCSLTEQRRTITDAIQLLGPHITMAHAKDRDGTGAFVAAGMGVLDYQHFLMELNDIGFTGPLVTHGLSASEAPAVAKFLTHTLSLPLQNHSALGVGNT